MNLFETTYLDDRKQFNRLRYQFQQECIKFPRVDFKRLDAEDLTHLAQDGKAPGIAWRNRYFLAALFDEGNGQARLCVHKTSLKIDGKWSDGITWDELMEVKRGIGLGEAWAVEVYPPDSETVNTANMRHLYLVGQPAFAWVKEKPEAEGKPGFLKSVAGIFREKEGA